MFFIERIDKPLGQHCLIINILHNMKQACLQGKQSEGRGTEKLRNRGETDRLKEGGRQGREDK